MLPLLKLAGDGVERTLRSAVNSLAESFSLTDAERNEFLPSGQQTTISNRVAWACTYLKKAELLQAPSRGKFRITERGMAVLRDAPHSINLRFLNQFPEFVEFRGTRRTREEITSSASTVDELDQTPHEALLTAHESLRAELAQEILNQLLVCDPSLFESIVVELVVKMGYGGSRQDAGRAIGRSGDEGIDGIIKEDYLGLDNIYIQAKRWNATVGRPEIQKFAGALQGQRAKKGIFITTSDYSRDALNFVSMIESKIILIDGVSLASLMIDFGVGVSPVANYQVYKIDSDFFTGT